MSFFPGKDPEAGDAYQCDAIAQVIAPRTVDLGDGLRDLPLLPEDIFRQTQLDRRTST